MKRATGKKTAVGLALSWDGARVPLRSMPAKARTFLAGCDRAPDAKEMVARLTDGSVNELRICWLPLLQGGDDALANPFETSDGLRIEFKSVKTTPLGDALGVIYRQRA